MKRGTLSRIERLELKAATTDLKPILNISVIVRSPEGSGEARAVSFAEWKAVHCPAKAHR